MTLPPQEVIFMLLNENRAVPDPPLLKAIQVVDAPQEITGVPPVPIMERPFEAPKVVKV